MPFSKTQSESLDAQEVMRALSNRSADGLDELIEIYQHRLMRFLMYLTRDRDQAEEVFQEVWLRVLRCGSSYNGRSPFEYWLFAIARNLVADLHRGVKPLPLDASATQDEEGPGFDVADTRPGAFEQMCADEEWRLMADAFGKLEAEHREVIGLRFGGELSLEEIAKKTGSHLSTVKSRLYRGLKVMQRQVQWAQQSPELQAQLAAGTGR